MSASKPNASSRSAEEIAREMVTSVDLEERYGWFATLNADGNDRALMCMTGVVVDDIEIDRHAAKEDAVRWLSRFIEQVRAESAPRAGGAPMRSAEEVAREMVRETADGDVQLWDGATGFGFVGWHPNEPETGRECAASLRQVIAGVIEQSRAEGAVAERERLRDASPIALHKPTGVRVGQVWRNVDRERDLEITSITNGIAKFGPNGDIMCAVEHMLTLEAWRFIREPSDLASRIRALVQQKAGEWVDAGLGDDATCDALSEVMRWLFNAACDARSGEDVSKWVVAMRRTADATRKRTALVFAKAANELEAIVRECEEKR